MAKRNLQILAFPLAASILLSGCFGHSHKQKPAESNTAEPDKLLFDRAVDDLKHGRQEIARLNLQTLINTYPDSEYLAEAKLSIADSFYKEGGSANLTQAVNSYKDFIVFFPFHPKAAYAQMQVGMTHYRRMEKPDRDRTEAKLAEEELQTFLQRYPTDPLVLRAEQRLREVQEVLAEGDFRVGYYYFIKQSYRAAESRLRDLAFRYPLYSKADRTLWMLGNIWEKSERKELASPYYSRIVRNYPLSDLASDARKKLTALGAPIPQPDLKALAWMQKEREADRGRPGIVRKATGLFRTVPDVSSAARTGAPTLTPASDTSPGTETLTAGGANSVGASGGKNMALVETVSPNSPGASATTGNPTNAESGVSSTTDVPPNGSAGDPPAATENPAANTNPSSAEGTASSETANSPPISPAEKSAASANVVENQGDKAKEAKGKGKDRKKESSSKKKKGFHKIVPW